MTTRLAEAIKTEAARIGANPADLATVMSYETGGTFDHWKKGPTTKWGTHRGLIQMGDPQREKYGYHKDMEIEDAVRASADYLVDAGFSPGMGLLEMYSAINAGGIGEKYYGRSDAGAGGAPGTVRDKVQYQMGSHKQKAMALLNGEFTPTEYSYYGDDTGQDLPEITTSPNDVISAPTPQTYVEQNANPDPQPYGFVEGVGANYQSFGITAHLSRWMEESGMDPSFTIGDDRGKHLQKSYAPQYHDFLLSSDSDFNLRRREEWVQKDMVRQARMSQSGTVANLSQGLVAGAIDPVSLGIGVASGGMGAALVGGGRVGRALYGAVSGAAMNAALDVGSEVITDNPYADPVMAGAAGALFGAFGGALVNTRGASFEGHAAYDAAASIRRGVAPPADAEPSASISLSGSGGAARNPEMRDSLIGLDRGASIEMADESVPVGFGGWFRKGDVTGQMTTAKNPMTRLIGANLFEETAGFTDHSVVPDSVNSRFRATHRKFEGNFNSAYLPAKSAYIKEAGLSRLNIAGRAQKELEFNRAVNDYIWDSNPSPDTSPHVVAAASAFRKGMADFATEMADAGMWKGGPDANYVPLVADHNVIARVDQLVHQEVMEKFFKDAIRAHASHISDDLAARMGRGYWSNIRKAGFGIEDSMSKALHLEDRDGFIKSFHEGLEDRNILSDTELAEVFDLLSGMMDATKKTEGDASGGIPRLKRRTLMDHNYKASVQMRDGSRVELRPRDLFEQDAELLFRRYSRSMSGRLEFAKTKIFNPDNGDLIVDGIRSSSELDKLKQSLKESYRLMPGTRSEKEAELKNALENIDFGWAKINGHPIYGSEKASAQWVRRIKAAQFIRLMSNMGLNQVQETWKIVSLTGFRSAMSQMPAIRDMSRAVATGKLSKDKLLNELGDMTGIGMENLWNRYDLRLDDERLGAETGGRFTQVVDNVLDAGQRLTANVSFMRQISDYQQRWAMKAITQQVADIARKARTEAQFDFSKIKEWDRQRLASIGLGEDDARKLFANILEHSEFDGKKIVGINTMKWDAETLSKYRVFLTRYTDRLVQQNDFGALSKWMSRPVFSLFVQFRSFVFGAWAKSTLWTLNHGALNDPKMWVLMLGEIAAGAATYAVRQSGTAVTEEGWEAYWEEAMQPGNLLKNGWARSATASVLPMFLDSLLMATPMGPQFGQARASGSATETFIGSPAVGHIDSAMAFSRGVSGALWDDEDVTQRDIRAGIRAFMPLGNWVPLTAALGALIEDTPR